MAFGTASRSRWGASWIFRLRAGPDLRKHRPNAFTAPPERIGPEPDLLCRLLRLRAFGVFPARLRAWLPPPLWPQKNHAAGGAVWRKEQNGKNPHRFSPLFYHNRTVFVKRSARKREFPNCALLSREAYAKGADLSEFPLFSPLFPQKNFSLTRLSETPTPVRKRRQRPRAKRGLPKSRFFETRAR